MIWHEIKRIVVSPFLSSIAMQIRYVREIICHPRSFYKALLKGKYFKCNFCHKKAIRFLHAGNDSELFHRLHVIGAGRRANACCPHCGSLDRIRWIYFVLQRYTNLFTGSLKVLHIAPEEILRKKILRNKNVDYHSGDIIAGRADWQIDITNMPFENESFDFIIANHVLEHVIFDREAIHEFFRCLSYGGQLLISVPICLTQATYENRLINSSGSDCVREYGQKDHVRLYGKDFRVRLAEAGFVVTEYVAQDCLSKEEIRDYCINSEERAFLCYKSL